MNGRIRALTTLASASVLMLGMMGGVDAAAPDKVGGASGPSAFGWGPPRLLRPEGRLLRRPGSPVVR